MLECVEAVVAMEKTMEQISLPQELSGHNYRVTYFTPGELIVDMTIDEAKVFTLMNSIREDGKIIEPIFVWIDKAGDRHIINGMHRTYSAQRLMNEMPNLLIPAVIVDCEESVFRAARVIAASPHIAIKASRINDWIRDAWLHSDLGKDANSGLLSSAYGVYQKSKKFKNEEVQSWFERNSKLWGIHIDQLAYIVLGSYRTTEGQKITNQTLLETSVKFDLSIEQHSMLCQSFPTVGRKGRLNDQQTIEQYVKDVIVELQPGQEPVTPAEYLKSKYLPKRKKEVALIEGKEERNHETERDLKIHRWANTVNGSKNFVEFLSTLMRIDFDVLFEKRPNSRKQISDVLSAAAVLARKFNGDIDVNLEVQRLRDELKAAETRIKHLETISREQSRTIKLPESARALSSTEIEFLR